MSLVFADSRTIRGIFPIWGGRNPQLKSAENPERELALDASKYWPTITGENPIPTGGTKSGWIGASFRDVTKSEILAGNPSLVVEFRDVISQRTHQIIGSLGHKGGQPLVWLEDVHKR